jgi:transcriptional regulator with XRE-family HTH domain
MEPELEQRWSRAVGETLRAERGVARLTQAEAARKADITRTSYRLYELGTRSPTAVQLAAIANTFGVSFAYLLGEVERRARRDS